MEDIIILSALASSSYTRAFKALGRNSLGHREKPRFEEIFA
jgi:hypothetical protein